jgi:DNA-binding PadR family transcriptional regulator
LIGYVSVAEGGRSIHWRVGGIRPDVMAWVGIKGHIAPRKSSFQGFSPLLFVYLFYKIESMKKLRFGSLELTVLNSVARLGEDAYGLGVRHDVSQLLGHDYSVGAIYTTLARLEEHGLVRSSTTDPIPVRGGRSRRLFRLSTAGRKALREAERLAARMWDYGEENPA